MMLNIHNLVQIQEAVTCSSSLVR